MSQAEAPAPELDDTLEWINSEPVVLGRCQGRVVALVFFNQSSAYCANLLDAMHHLSLQHPQQLQVIGLHVPKYPAERDAGRVRDAVGRLGIRFPVASDRDYVAWQHYGVRGWPSVALLDHRGVLRELVAGDIAPQLLEQAIEPLLREAPMPLDEGATAVGGRRLPRDRVLWHPSGLAVGERRLYIADSGRHRVLECTLEGRVLNRWGTGHPEHADGGPGEAAFDHPQGLLLHREALYIADAGNHALRRLDLRSGKVETLAGNGRPGLPGTAAIDSPREVSLNRPCGLAGDGERIYVSLAGANQVWALDLGSGSLAHVAGSGELGCEDGNARYARLAHPAGLALNQNSLYILDSASASLRRLTFNDGELRTLIGGGGLFESGNEDGPRERARLRFPTGMVLQTDAPVLWIADAGNDQFRTLRLGGGAVATAQLGEVLRRPCAVASSPGAVWLADTDNHRVLRLDVGAGAVTAIEVTEEDA